MKIEGILHITSIVKKQPSVATYGTDNCEITGEDSMADTNVSFFITQMDARQLKIGQPIAYTFNVLSGDYT